MKSNVCKICGDELVSLRGLHKHLNAVHNLTQAEYYQHQFPRYDLYTGKFILYKTRDQYFSQDFNDREDFGKWLKKNIKKPECLDYCVSKLKERFQDKQLSHTPGHAELSSLMLPNIFGWQKLMGLDKYCELCQDLGSKRCFDYSKRFRFEEVKRPDFCIYIDTREKRPLYFRNLNKVTKLDFGDYGSNYCDFAIERKSLPDLFSTLSAGYERFEREIERSSYLIVLVEEKLENVRNYRPISRLQRANGTFVFKRMRDLLAKYPNVQFLFSGDRDTSVKICQSLLTHKISDIQDIDLQHSFELCGNLQPTNPKKDR